MRDRAVPPRSTRCCCRPRRPSTPSSRCWPIRSSSTAGSAPTPISSTCSTCAASRCRRRCAPTARRSASRCWRRRAATRCSPRIGRVFHADTGLPLGALGRAAAAAGRACRPCPRRTRSRSPWSARICPACRSTANCKALGARFLEEPRRPRRTTGSMRSTAARRRSPGCCASRRAQGAAIAARDLGAAGGRLRPLRRRDPAAAVDRHAAARRRPQREGLSGRGRGGRGRARHLELRRLARLSRAARP